MAQKFTVPITVKQLSSASSDAVTVFVDADTYARLKVEAGGRLVWGSGSGAGDVNLYRDAADVLRTDDTFKTPTLFVDSIEIDPTGATTDQILKFNGTKFAPATGGGGGATNLDGLTDVVVTTPAEFQTLQYDGTNWVNSYSSVVTYVRNVEATTLTTGTVVYLFGATGDHATVKRADNNSDTTSSKTVGLVGASITASGNGPVITRGYVDGIDLSVGYTSGDVLWLGENGAFTTTKPTAPDHLVFVGVVVRATNNGIIYVATQNGYELDELHNVSIPSPISGDFLKYNGTLWVNDQINLGTDTVGNYVASLVAGNNITLSNNSGEGATPTINSGMTISDTIPSSPTNGQVWYESDTGKTFVYYDSFWVEIVGSTGAAGPTGAQGATGATGAAGIVASVGLVSANYYGSIVATTSNFTMVEDRTYYTPFYLSESATFDRILNRTNTFSGSAVVRLGVYNNSGGKPTTVVFDAGTVSVTAAATAYTITINETLSAGWYWLASNMQTAGTTNVFTGSATFIGLGSGQYPPNGSVNFTSYCWFENSVTGAFATAGSLSESNGSPLIALRKT